MPQPLLLHLSSIIKSYANIKLTRIFSQSIASLYFSNSFLTFYYSMVIVFQNTL